MLSSSTESKTALRNSTELILSSKSGNDLRATITENLASSNRIGIVLCPGFAIGKEGEFVKTMEHAAFSRGLAKFAIRFNFSGHQQDGFNDNLTGFSFQSAVHDFRAAVGELRARGAHTVVALCSSTGAQAAILAACSEGESAEVVIGRASIVDCFKSIVQTVPETLREQWEASATFQFPVGVKPVTLSGALIKEIKDIDLREAFSRLSIPVFLIHGGQDQTSRLAAVEATCAFAPEGRISIEAFPHEKHEMANDPAAPTFDRMLSLLEATAIGRLQ